MENQRSHRVGDLIQKEISGLLLKGIKDPRVGFVTITAVEVTSDLSLAKVFFTAMGDEKARKDSEAGLKSSLPYLRRELGKRLRLRHVPELMFKYDESLAYGSKIEAILREIKVDNEDNQGDS